MRNENVEPLEVLGAQRQEVIALLRQARVHLAWTWEGKHQEGIFPLTME